MLSSFIFWWVFCAVMMSFNYGSKESDYVQRYDDYEEGGDVRWKYIDW